MSTVLERPAPSYYSLNTFSLPPASHRKYGQYADLYFARLVLLKSHVENVAEKAWAGFSLAGIKARPVERVLDVRQGEVCWVTGTVFMDMPLKPNIMEDLGKEVGFFFLGIGVLHILTCIELDCSSPTATKILSGRGWS
jgi:DNA polymerase delta subunit OB-fold domain